MSSEKGRVQARASISVKTTEADRKKIVKEGEWVVEQGLDTVLYQSLIFVHHREVDLSRIDQVTIR